MSDYVSIADARGASGLRMVCLRGVPSPWTEAARGIFHVKGLECRYAARGEDEPGDAIVSWAGDSSVPVVAWEREPLRTGWAEILLLAERLAAEPALVPAEGERRVELFGLGHEICGEMGLGWCLRLLLLQRSLGHDGGGKLPANPAARLAGKYGFTPWSVRQAKPRVIEILGMLDARLMRHPYLLGDDLCAADIYWATFANLLTPLPEPQLPAVPMIREAYAGSDDDVLAAVSDRLRGHQVEIYERFLELPVPL